MTAASVTVRRAKLGPRGAAAGGRASLQRWLADIHLTHHGLPAQAIVIVRRLRAPVTAFQEPGDDPLAHALRGALRPAHENFVGAGVAAVWFADEAELLACLARDVVGGELAARWWWPLLFGHAATPARVLQRWVAAPQVLPWALQALEATGQGASWLAQLEPVGRDALVQAVSRAYPVCDAVLRGVERANGVPASAAVDGLGSKAAGRQSVVSSDDRTDTAAAMPSGAQVLLRLAAVLRQAPQRAANPGLLVELLAPVHASRRVAVEVAPGDVMAVATEQAASAPRSERTAHRSCQSPLVPGAPPALAAAPLLSDAPRPAITRLPAARWAPQAPPTAEWARSAAAGRAASPQPRASPVTQFTTQFGGVCFLLNVALHLGLYGDFTQPQHPGLPVSPWRLLHKALNASHGHAGRADPLAHWLRQRGGIAEPRLITAWQLPLTALQPFRTDARPWHALAAPDGLQLWHPAGFCVAHRVPSDGLPALLAHLQQPPQTVVMHTAGRWRRAPRLSALAWPLLRARVALAMGLPARAALALCLPLPAHVRACGERLDLHFSLAALPLAVRLAGLDRDPGWLPAAGSDIRFHFD